LIINIRGRVEAMKPDYIMLDFVPQSNLQKDK